MTHNQQLLVDELRKLDPTEQCHGVLRTADGKMCVHGVMCDLYIRLTGEGEWAATTPFPAVFKLGGEAYATSAPDKVLEFFDVKHFEPEIDATSLMDLNDNALLSLVGIANEIEADPENVYA